MVTQVVDEEVIEVLDWNHTLDDCLDQAVGGSILHDVVLLSFIVVVQELETGPINGVVDRLVVTLLIVVITHQQMEWEQLFLNGDVVVVVELEGLLVLLALVNDQVQVVNFRTKTRTLELRSVGLDSVHIFHSLFHEIWDLLVLIEDVHAHGVFHVGFKFDIV